MQKSRSPISRKLLKLPGHDVDKDLQEFVDDNLIAPGLVLMTIGSICLVEWIQYLSRMPPNPWIYTAWFLGSAGVIVVHWSRQWKRALAKKLGRDGERAIAEYLNIRLSDARVFHGVPLDGGLADHLLVSAQGLFVIETKTRSLPRRGEPIVHVTDSKFLIAGFQSQRDPVRQVEWYLRGLRKKLSRIECAQNCIYGVVVFPGWQVRDRRSSPSRVAVVGAQDLAAYVASKPVALSKQEVTYVARRVARRLRALDHAEHS